MQSVDRIAKTTYGALRKNTGGNDTVPISVSRGGGICAQRSMELVMEFFVLKWSVRPRVRAF